MQPKNKLAKNFLYLAIFITIVVITWIAGAVYNGLYKSTVPQDTSAYSTPITPSFDMQTMNSLQAKKAVPVDFGSTISPYLGSDSGSESASLSPSETGEQEQPLLPSPTEEPQASKSAEVITVTPSDIPVIEP